MSSFFSPLNLPIWLKRYSLQFAVGMDNIPPQMDSLEPMGNMCQTNLHIPHAAVFSLSWSPSCWKAVIHSTNPMPTPCLLRSCTIITIIVVLFCLLFLQSIKKKKKIVHNPLNTPIKSFHTLYESKFKKMFNLTPGTPELTICFSQKYKEWQGKKKKRKKPNPSWFSCLE